MVFPPQLKVPDPLCVRAPFTVMVEAARVEGMPPPPPGGGYGALLMDETPRLLMATAGIVAVG